MALKYPVAPLSKRSCTDTTSPFSDGSTRFAVCAKTSVTGPSMLMYASDR